LISSISIFQVGIFRILILMAYPSLVETSQARSFAVPSSDHLTQVLIFLLPT